MATFLDVTALQQFSVIFVFLFVALFVYAILMYTKMFGANQWIPIFAAAILAIFVVMSETATEIIKGVAPIFVVVVVFILILSVVGSSMMGQGSVPEGIQGLKWVVLVILAIALIVGTLATIREKVDVPEPGEEDFEKTSSVIFHPNFIGLILFFMVAIFTVALLATKSM